MAQKKSVHPLHRSIHPIFPALVAVIGICVLGILIAPLLQSKNTPQETAHNYQQTATPTPVDMSTWKTWTDWKYNYSIKLPQEFTPYRPTKGYLNNDPDPDGTGRMQFEDTSTSGNYPNTTAKYGFGIDLGLASLQAQQCTTDQECYKLLTDFYKNIGTMSVMPIQATILNRNIKGLAVLTSVANTSSPTGQDYTLYDYYNLAVNGRRFGLDIQFTSPKSFQDEKAKEPLVNAILSTISFK